MTNKNDKRVGLTYRDAGVDIDAGNRSVELMKQHVEPKSLISIPIRIGERVILIKPEKVAYLTADEKYVDLFTLDGKKYTTNLSLKKLEERLPFNFKRIHQIPELGLRKRAFFVKLFFQLIGLLY